MYTTKQIKQSPWTTLIDTDQPRRQTPRDPLGGCLTISVLIMAIILL